MLELIHFLSNSSEREENQLPVNILQNGGKIFNRKPKGSLMFSYELKQISFILSAVLALN